MRSVSQERALSLLKYNPDTGDLRWGVNRGKRSEGDLITTRMPAGYLLVGIDYRTHLAHRVIWLMVHGEMPKCVDHINGIRHDNRIANLRSVSHLENNRNRKITRPSLSGVMGVRWWKFGKMWRSTITDKGSLIQLGESADLFEAICIRKAAEVRLGYHSLHGTLPL